MSSAYLPKLRRLRPTFRANCLRQNIFPRKTSLTQLLCGYDHLFPTSEPSIWLTVIWLKVSTEMQKVSNTIETCFKAYSPRYRPNGVLDLQRGDGRTYLRGHAPQGKSPSRNLCLRVRVAFGSSVPCYRPNLQRTRYHCAGAVGYWQDSDFLHQYSTGAGNISSRDTRYGQHQAMRHYC